MSAQLARPYFFPEALDFASLPRPVQLAIYAIVVPAYNELVLAAASALERSAGATFVFYLTLELLEQFDLGEMIASGFLRAGSGASREAGIARCLRLSTAKDKAAGFLLRVRTFRARYEADPLRFPTSPLDETKSSQKKAAAAPAASPVDEPLATEASDAPRAEAPSGEAVAKELATTADDSGADSGKEEIATKVAVKGADKDAEKGAQEASDVVPGAGGEEPSREELENRKPVDQPAVVQASLTGQPPGQAAEIERPTP